MYPLRIQLAALATLAAALAAAPTDARAAPLDLSALLRHAAQHSPELRAARARWQALRSTSIVVQRWPEPTVSGGAFLRPVETRVGPQRGKIGVTIPIPWPDKFRLRGAAVLARATVQRRRVDAKLARLEAEIRRQWARRAWFLDIASAYDGQSKLLVDLEASVLTRLRVGKATYADAQRLRLMISALDDKATSARDAVRPLDASLRALADVAPDVQLGAAGFEADAFAGAVVPPVSVFAARLKNQPDVLVAEAAIIAATAKVAAAATSSKPDFGVGLDWLIVGASRSPSAPDSGDDALLLRASVKLPVWRSSYDAEVDAAEADRRGATAQRDRRLQAARALLAALLFDLRDARRKRLLYASDLVPRATSALVTVVQGYVNGRAAFQSVVELQRQLLDYEIGLSTAERRRVEAAASLEALVVAPLQTFARPNAGSPTHTVPTTSAPASKKTPAGRPMTHSATHTNAKKVTQ